jgi:hypothetical protein
MVGSESRFDARLMVLVTTVLMTGGCCFRLYAGGSALGGCAQENKCDEQGREFCGETQHLFNNSLCVSPPPLPFP